MVSAKATLYFQRYLNPQGVGGPQMWRPRNKDKTHNQKYPKQNNVRYLNKQLYAYKPV